MLLFLDAKYFSNNVVFISLIILFLYVIIYIYIFYRFFIFYNSPCVTVCFINDWIIVQSTVFFRDNMREIHSWLMHWFEKVRFSLKTLTFALIIKWPNLPHSASVHLTSAISPEEGSPLRQCFCQLKSATKEDKIRLFLWRGSMRKKMQAIFVSYSTNDRTSLNILFFPQDSFDDRDDYDFYPLRPSRLVNA